MKEERGHSGNECRYPGVTAEPLQVPTVRPSAQHGLQVRHQTRARRSRRGEVEAEKEEGEHCEPYKGAETRKHSYFKAS